MKKLIIVAALLAGCGDKDDDTGADTAVDVQDTDDGAEPEDTAVVE